MKPRFCATLLLALVVSLCLTLHPSISRADEPPKDLDILFLVDQSGSMGGDPANLDLPPNDPLSLRFFGPRFAMQWLGSDRLSIHRESTFRMAVVHFGSTVQEGMDWKIIAPDTGKEWTSLRTELEEALRPVDLAERSLGNTDFVLAFREAKRYFERLEGSTSLTGHSKAVVVLTDGGPYVDEEGFSLHTHMRQVQEIVKSSFRSEDGFAVYIVAIQENEKNSWPRMKPFWDNIANGRAEQVHSDFEVGVRFQDILQELTNDFPQSATAIDQTIEPGLVLVNPFLQSLTFTFFKSAPDQRHSVLLPDGSALIESNSAYEILGADDPIEVVTVFDPEPGYWTITAPPGSKSQIKSRQVSAVGTLLIPPGPHTEHLPISIAFTLLGSDGSSVPHHDWPIDIQAIVKWDGESQELELSPAENDRFLTTFTPVSTGDHQLNILAKSVNSARESVELFQEVAKFKVEVLVIEPATAVVQTDLFKPTALSYYLTDAHGRAVSVMPQDIKFEVSLNGDQSWPLRLTLEDEGILTGTFVPAVPGNHKVLIIDSISSPRTLDEFMVVEPNVSLGEIADTVYQYTNVGLSLLVRDGQGEAPVWSDEYELNATATVEGELIPFKPVSAGEYAATYRPTQTGDQLLSVTANVIDKKSGKSIYTLLRESLSFTVKPSQIVKLVPGKERQVWRTLQFGFPLLTPTPWQVTLYLQDEHGQPLELTSVTNAKPADLFQVSAHRGETDIAPTNWSVDSLGGGQRQITGENLGPGNFRVKIEPNPVLFPGFVWGDTPTTVLLRRVENPVVRVGQITLVALLLVLAVWGASALRGSLIRYIRSKNPCKGVLAVRDADNHVLWGEIELDAILSNHITFERKDMNPLTRLKKLSVWQAQKDPDKEPRIRVNISLETGGTIRNVVLSPGDEQKLDPHDLWLTYGRSRGASGQSISDTKSSA